MHPASTIYLLGENNHLPHSVAVQVPQHIFPHPTRMGGGSLQSPKHIRFGRECSCTETFL